MATKPIVEGLFDPEHQRLIVSICQDCRARAFPPRQRRCAACGGTNLERETSASSGVIYSWTVIRELGGYRPDFQPYIVALVDLDPGIRVQGLVDADPGTVSVGRHVRIGTMPVPGGDLDPGTVTYCFVPGTEAAK